MQKRSFDQQKKESSRGVNTEFHADKSERRCELDVVRRTKLLDRVNDEFLYQVRTVRDAGDERCARNLYSSKNQPRTLRADEEPSHAECDKRELPDAGDDGEIIAFAEIQAITDQRQSGQAEPDRKIRQSLPPVRSEFFDCGEHNTEDEGIEPSPGWVIDPRLKRTERNTAVDRRILPSQNCAQCEPAENDNAWNNQRSARTPIHKE